MLKDCISPRGGERVGIGNDYPIRGTSNLIQMIIEHFRTHNN